MFHVRNESLHVRHTLLGVKAIFCASQLISSFSYFVLWCRFKPLFIQTLFQALTMGWQFKRNQAAAPLLAATATAASVSDAQL